LKKLFFIFFLIFVFIINNVYAIGITPPSHTSVFQDLKTESYVFTIYTNPTESTYIEISLEGVFSEFATVDLNSFTLQPGQKQDVTLTFTYPKYEDINVYGSQKLRLVAEEKPGPGSGFAAVTAVIGQIRMEIPVPGEYAKITNFEIPSIEKGKDTEIKLTIANKGTDNLINKKTQVDIYSPTGEFLQTFNFDNINIAKGQDLTLKKPLLSNSFIEGKYYAEVHFKYADSQPEETKNLNFYIGATDIILESYTTNLTKGKINKIDLIFQSIWGSPLNNIRAEVFFNGSSEVLPILDFQPFGRTLIPAYLNVPDSDLNTTTGMVNIEIPTQSGVKKKSVEMKFNLLPNPDKKIETKPFFKTTLGIVIISLAILIVLVLIILNIYLLTRNKNDKDKKK
jgi:hypothetical protein